MKATLLAIVAALVPMQDTAKFSDPFLGLEFTHPATWKVQKKQKDRTVFALPIEGSSETAELEISRTPFHSDKSIWQTLQVRANETMQREIVRQWEQDVLQVPVLFTQVNWTDKAGSNRTTLSGLYYTRTPLKLLVRLTSSQGDFDKARYDLMSALESLRTVDGSNPQVDDENVKFDNLPKKGPVAPPVRKTISAEVKPTAEVKAPTTVNLTVSTKPVVVRVPEGWTSEEVKEDRFVLKHAEFPSPLTVEVRSTLDSEAPQTGLFKLSSQSLSKFKSVTNRYDTNAKPNKAGCAISTIWRVGKAESGDLVTFEVSGLQAGHYFLMSGSFTDVASFKAARARLDDFLSTVGIESPQP